MKIGLFNKSAIAQAMKNIILIFFLCASVLISHAQNNNKACLRELKRDTKKYWYYDKDKKYYVANDTFVRKLAASYYTCLEGMDTSYVLKILGKRNVHFESNVELKQRYIRYDLKPPLGAMGEKLFFEYNNKGKIIKIDGIDGPYMDSNSQY